MKLKKGFIKVVLLLFILSSCNKEDTVFTCPDFNYDINAWSPILNLDTLKFRAENNAELNFIRLQDPKGTGSIPNDYLAPCNLHYSDEILCVQDSLRAFYSPELNLHLGIKFIDIIEKENLNRLVYVNYDLKKTNHLYYDNGIDFQIEPAGNLLSGQEYLDSVTIQNRIYYHVIINTNASGNAETEVDVFTTLEVSKGFGIIRFTYQGLVYYRVE